MGGPGLGMIVQACIPARPDDPKVAIEGEFDTAGTADLVRQLLGGYAKP